MDWYVIWDYRSSLIDGIWLTVQLSILGIVGSTVVGALVGCASTLSASITRRLMGTYVEVLRNVPLVVKLFFAHFIVGLDAFPSALLALTLHQSAYIADLTAAGLRSIPQGQTEAALSCGHTYGQVLRYVVFPQAIRHVIPPLTTQYVQVLKNSAVVMFIALEDLAFMTQKIEEETYRNFEAATATTVIYLALAMVIAVAMSVLQHFLARR
jgi:His/Glu/Gln/Arg/opine family amino acid ABC transporter permease subunit